VSDGTGKRYWTFARAFLLQRLKENA
jgi:hypothetical protein